MAIDWGNANITVEEVKGVVAVTTVIGRSAAATTRIYLKREAALRLATKLIDAARQDQWIEFNIGDPPLSY